MEKVLKGLGQRFSLPGKLHFCIKCTQIPHRSLCPGWFGALEQDGDRDSVWPLWGSLGTSLTPPEPLQGPRAL